MPPVERSVPSSVAEPPQEGLPYGRWAERLEEELLACWAALDTDGAELGEPGEIAWYPDRGWHGRPYGPATLITPKGAGRAGRDCLVPRQRLARTPLRAGHLDHDQWV